MKDILIQEEPVKIESILDNGTSDADGADIVFIGRVRKNSRDREVLHIDYDIYPEMAMSELGRIAEEAIEKTGLNRCIIVHRYGRVFPG